LRLQTLNWRRDPGYEQRMQHNEQRKMQHEQRMKQLENEIELLRSESAQIDALRPNSTFSSTQAMPPAADSST